MINILLEGYEINAPWLYDELKNYIKPHCSVAIVAFSFRDSRVKTLSDWEKLYKERYGHKYVEEVGDIRKSPIFQMSNDKLKIKVSNDPSWREICRAMYPAFPNWLSKADSIILLFAKLYQENRLDDLRMELINRSNNKH